MVTGASRQVQMAFLGLEFQERISTNREGRGETCALIQLGGLVPGNGGPGKLLWSFLGRVTRSSECSQDPWLVSFPAAFHGVV